MKRLLSLTVALLLLLACVSCGEDEDALVRVTSYLGARGEHDNVKLSQAQQSELLAFLEGLDADKHWDGGNATNCIKEYRFETQTRLWRYCSDDGDIQDVANNRLLFLSQEQADTLHDLLGIPRITVRDRS